MVATQVAHHAMGMPYEPQVTRFKSNLKRELAIPPPVGMVRSLATPRQFHRRAQKGDATPQLPFIDARWCTPCFAESPGVDLC